MAPMFTSYKWKSTELNDGVSYLVPLSDTSFDDRNAADATWAYRKGDVPVQVGLTIKEGSFVLPISVKATSYSDWRTKLDALKKLFDTRDPQHYKFERKLRHESVYSYVMAAPREFMVNETEHKVVITMQTADRTWLAPTWIQPTITLWETVSRTEDLIINYDGSTEYEPVITLQLLTEGRDGPRPIYYHYVTVYTQGASHVVNTPTLAVSGWNTSGMVSSSEIRADGLDIEVEFTNGQDIPRYIGGTAAARKVWIKPTAWPWRFDVVLSAPPTWNPMLEPADPMLSNTAMVAYITVNPAAKPDVNGFTTEFPASGTFMVDGEIISYSAVQWLNTEMTHAKLTLTARGVAGGTAAANHTEYRRVLFPTTLVVRYGYPTGYEFMMTGNNLAGWPLLDYELSSNTTWVQTAFFSPYSGMTPLYGMNWVTYDKASTATDKRYIGEGMLAQSIYGVAAVNRTAKMKIVGQNTGNDFTVAVRGYNRLSLNPFGGMTDRAKGRVLSYVRFYPKLLSTVGRRITCRAKVVRRSFGSSWWGTGGGEVQELLWTQAHTGAVQTAYDSGWLWTGMWSKEFQTVCIELDHIPAGQTTAVDNLLLDRVDWLLDNEYGGSPAATTIGGQNGGSTVNMTIRNLNDTQTGTTFTTNTLMGVADVMTIDCANRTVTGALLKEVSYRNPTWLRLLPGTNTIRFTGAPNIGQVLATVKYQVKK